MGDQRVVPDHRELAEDQARNRERRQRLDGAEETRSGSTPRHGEISATNLRLRQGSPGRKCAPWLGRPRPWPPSHAPLRDKPSSGTNLAGLALAP
jgi:hypothetical protein